MMRCAPTTTAVLALAVLSSGAARAEEPVDLVMVTRIRDEGFNRSKVMETMAQLTDVIGPRLTGSPNLKKANEWTRERLLSWGLPNAHLEKWGPFGRGWSFERASIHMVSPQAVPLIAIPKAWTPGTAGAVRGRVVKVKLEAESDLEKVKGQLQGAVVFLANARDLKAPEKALFSRYNDKDLAELSLFDYAGPRGDFPRALPPGEPRDRESFLKRFRFQKRLREFLAAEKAVATVEPSERDGGVVRVGAGGPREKGEESGILGLVMAAEHYNRICRLIDLKTDVELEIDVKAQFYDDDPMGYNTIADIPGTDKKGEVVMVGAHLDSWHAGTGATDNAAGSAVAMEAVRILQALGVKPKRAIRIGLWTGEEQGLLGSRAYASEHFASRPDPTDPDEKNLPRYLRRVTGPLTVKPEHARFSAYFNLDNGTGKIRGIYTQQNAGVAPIFEAWLKPFADLGATAVTQRNTGGTDHQSFDGVGLPGFQFIQDQADYATRTHHTNMDVFDRIQREDLMQAAVILATFAYQAATRAELFPRKPLPPDQPVPSPSPSATPTPETGS